MHRINVHRILCMWITNQFDTKAEAFNIQGSYLSLSSRDAEHLLDLNFVEDVNAISAINWTSLTLNHLMKSIKKN